MANLTTDLKLTERHTRAMLVAVRAEAVRYAGTYDDDIAHTASGAAISFRAVSRPDPRSNSGPHAGTRRVATLQFLNISQQCLPIPEALDRALVHAGVPAARTARLRSIVADILADLYRRHGDAASDEEDLATRCHWASDVLGCELLAYTTEQLGNLTLGRDQDLSGRYALWLILQNRRKVAWVNGLSVWEPLGPRVAAAVAGMTLDVSGGNPGLAATSQSRTALAAMVRFKTPPQQAAP